MKRRVEIGKIKRVIVRGTNWVGDAAMSVPALRELRRVLPEAHITLCTKPFASGIFADADFIDDILLLEREKSAVATILKQAKIWRTREFDLAILFQNAFQAALLARLGKAKYRIGYKTDARSFLLTNALDVPKWKNNRHEVFYYLNVIAELETLLRGESDVLQREPNINLQVAETRKIEARELLRENGVDLSRKTVALCAGSINSRAKRWQSSSYAELADLIDDRLNANVVLIGSPDELEVSKQVLDLSNSKPILLTGKTSLAEVVAVLSVVDLLVTNDTGPAHIAPALNTKTIVIFGPTIPDTTRPFSNLAQIIRKPPSCAPCMLRDCPIDHRCMTAISANDVFAQIVDLLDDRAHQNELF